jgi:hypothetical protein
MWSTHGVSPVGFFPLQISPVSPRIENCNQEQLASLGILGANLGRVFPGAALASRVFLITRDGQGYACPVTRAEEMPARNRFDLPGGQRRLCVHRSRWSSVGEKLRSSWGGQPTRSPSFPVNLHRRPVYFARHNPIAARSVYQQPLHSLSWQLLPAKVLAFP